MYLHKRYNKLDRTFGPEDIYKLFNKNKILIDEDFIPKLNNIMVSHRSEWVVDNNLNKNIYFPY